METNVNRKPLKEEMVETFWKAAAATAGALSTFIIIGAIAGGSKKTEANKSND